MKTIFFLWLMVCLSGGMMNAGCQDTIEDIQMKKKINGIFEDYMNEDFLQEENPALESGWMMPLPSGRQVTRSFLQIQAGPVITLGKDAVPYLFEWVMSENLPVRYIAVYSLQEITGLKPHIAHFDQEDNDNTRGKAIQTWKLWCGQQQ